MLTSLLSLDHALVNLEVPVHVSSLLLLSCLIISETTSALSARNAKVLIKRHDQMWAWTICVRINFGMVTRDDLHLQGLRVELNIVQCCAWPLCS